MYFKEILEKDFAGVSFSKRMYVYKHYILFTYLADQKLNINNINGTFNKLMVLLLWAPGTIIAKRKFNNNQEK